MTDSSSPPRPQPDDEAGSDAIASLTAGMFDGHEVLGLDEHLALFAEVAERNRFAVLYVLATAGKRSAKELGGTLGRSENGLHYHLDRLVDAGLVENRKRARPDEAGLYSYYELTGLGADLIDAVTSFVQAEKDALEDY